MKLGITFSNYQLLNELTDSRGKLVDNHGTRI